MANMAATVGMVGSNRWAMKRGRCLGGHLGRRWLVGGKKKLQKTVAAMGFDKQNTVAGGDNTSDAVGGGFGSTIGHEGNKMTMVHRPEAGRRLAGGSTKWQQY